MLDYRSWLGLGDDEDDPVKKALGALGQGASAVGQAVQDVGASVGSAVSPYLPQPSATPAPEDYSSSVVSPPPAPDLDLPSSRMQAPPSAYDTDQPFRPTPRIGETPTVGAVPTAPDYRRQTSPGPAPAPALAPVAPVAPAEFPEPTEPPWYVRAGMQATAPEREAGARAISTVAPVLGSALGALDAANEWLINNPVTGALNLQAGGRELAGWEQIGAETREDQDRLEALIRRYQAGDTGVEPEVQALTASLNRRTRADRASLLAAGERNPNKGAETLGGLVQGVAATALAPGAGAGAARNVAGLVLDPLGQAQGLAVEGLGPALGAARRGLGANAERVAAADARMAAEGSTQAPGALGVAMGTDVQGMARPRVIPPDVADTLDFPLRVPTDPAHIRAIEAAGGRVDPERGVDLPLVRMQDEPGAGQTATRGGVFYTAGEPGTPSPYAGTGGPTGVGGDVRVEAPTRYRSPLILSEAPGDEAGFAQGMAQLGITDGTGHPLTPQVVNQRIRLARLAGPVGSPERAHALKALVARYGGDPELVDEAIALRGDSPESAWAIKENILASNARKQGYDGVLTVQQSMGGKDYQDALEAAVQAHPDYQAQQAIYDDLDARLSRAPGQSQERVDLWDRRDAADRKLGNIHDRLVDTVKVEPPSRITELMDPREARNPTPGPQTGAWQEAHRRVANISEELDEAAAEMDHAERLGSDDAWRSARSQWEYVRKQYDAAVDARESLRGTPGYTLREDIPRRGGETTAPGMAGTLPPGAATDRLASVNRVLGQGIASSVSGGVGAQVNQELNPDDPLAGIKGFAAGALVPPLAASGGMALARRAGRGAERAEGALAAFGQAPGGGGAPGGGLLAAFPGVGPAYRRAAQRNAAEMARANITPATAVDVARGAVGAIGHGALLGPSSSTVQGAQSLWNLAWSLPKEPLRAAARAVSTGNPSALREPGEMASGALMGLGKLGEAVWDVVRGKGRYAPVPGHEPTSARIADPFLRNVVGALETPGRLWASLPDAIAGTIAEESVVGRRAAQRATDAGLSGAAWEQEVARLRGEAGQARAQQRAGGRQQARAADVTDVLGAAEQAGVRAGLRQPLGDIGRAARKASGADIPVVGQFLAPYFNSPWNAMLQMAERTPAGLAMSTQASKFDRRYDAVVGTAATIAVADQMRRGNITVNGSGPTDSNERQAWIDRGNRPYSLKVGDLYLPNRSFGYAEGMLNAVGEYHDALAYRKEGASDRWTSEDAFRRIGRLLKEQPYAAGFSTLYDMAQFGPASLAADLATRATPGAATLRAIGTSRDTSERTVDRGANVPLGQEALERWQQSVGLRGDLPVAQDILGRPKENPQQGIAAFLPRIGTAREDPVISVFQEAGVFPGNPPAQLTIPNLTDEALKPDLTPAEQRRWDALRGEMLLASVGPLAQDPGWQSVPREVRAKELERRRQEAGTLAHQRLAGEIGAAEIKRRIGEKVDQRTRRAS